MNTFIPEFQQQSWSSIHHQIYSSTVLDVQHSLAKDKKSLTDFMHLLSPAATHSDQLLSAMAQQAQAGTRRRFGATMQLFAPLYMSNECQNICTYCGFSQDNPIRRKTLSATELLLEAMAIKEMGINHVLLVSGEAHQRVGMPYFLKAVALLKPHFDQISLEVQPLSSADYQELKAAGVYGIYVYQETYCSSSYSTYHPKGRKSNFHHRLSTPDRIAGAQLHKIGLGALLGLQDWRVDSFYTALHIDFLQRHYWKTSFGVSFPRLRPASGISSDILDNRTLITDRELLQLICAYRIWNEQLDLSLSTREEPQLRDILVQYGITSMSAASKTNPGGYVVDPQALQQFEVSDERSVLDIHRMLQHASLDVVYKNWDYSFST